MISTPRYFKVFYFLPIRLSKTSFIFSNSVLANRPARSDRKIIFDSIDQTQRIILEVAKTKEYQQGCFNSQHWSAYEKDCHPITIL